MGTNSSDQEGNQWSITDTHSFTHNEITFDSRLKSFITSLTNEHMNRLSSKCRIFRNFKMDVSFETFMIISCDNEHLLNQFFSDIYKDLLEKDPPSKYEDDYQLWNQLVASYDRKVYKLYCSFCFKPDHSERNCGKCGFCLNDGHLSENCGHFWRLNSKNLKYKWIYPKPKQTINPLTHERNRIVKEYNFRMFGFDVRDRPCVTKDAIINHKFPKNLRFRYPIEISLDVEMATGISKNGCYATQVVVKQFMNSQIGDQTIFASHISDNLHLITDFHLNHAQQNLPNRLRTGLPLKTVRAEILKKIPNSIVS